MSENAESIDWSAIASEIRGTPCEYAVRLPGKTPSGLPLGPSYGGDTATLCGRPGIEEEREGGRYVVVRCSEHMGL